MKITLQGFTGEVPRIAPRYLPDQVATVARHCRVTGGDLEPMHAPLAWDDLSEAADRIYLYGSTWLSWPGDADAVPGPVAEDRLYITTSTGAPQMRHAGDTYALALPRPDTAPGVTIAGDPDADTIEQTIYAYTWVTSLGEESPPSPLPGAVEMSQGQTATITMTADPPTDRLVASRRIYRSQTSLTGGTALFFVAEVPVATTSYVHDPATAPAAEAITSTDFDPPPDTLRGLTAMPNGVIAGFSGRDVYFCEPYQPHAWPEKYVLTVNHDIVGLAAFGTALAVLTTGTPYLIQGLHPDQMAMERMEVDFPCVAKRGIVDLGYAAIYPSTEGLVQISVTGATLVSGSVWTRDQWLALNPATIRAGRHSGRYLFSVRAEAADPASRHLLAFTPAQDQPFVTRCDGAAHRFLDLSHHLQTGRCFGLADDGTSIVSIDDADAPRLTLTWRSKPFRVPGPVPMGCVLIDADPAAPGQIVRARVFADGKFLHMVSGGNVIHRLPVPRAAPQVWEVEIEANAHVTRAVLCGTPDEVYQ